MTSSNTDEESLVLASDQSAHSGEEGFMKLRRLRVLMLTNWKNDGKWQLARTASSHVQRFDFLEPAVISHPSKFGSFLNRLLVTWSEFYVPVLAIFRRAQYDVVVSWTSRLGVVYGILNRLVPGPRAAKHLTNDFHIDLRRKDLPYQFRLALLRLAEPGMDVCLCTSTREEKIYADMFSSPADKFRFLPIGYPAYFEYPTLPRKDYIFSYGNSARDFCTLIKAVKGLDTPVVILSQALPPLRELPPNVTVVKHRVSSNELIELLRLARFVVLPLLHFEFSVGQLALTEVMSLGCPLVITANMATVEYATHGESALFFDAGDVTGLKAQIEFLVENPSVAAQLGDKARKRARECSRQNAAVFLEVLKWFAERQPDPAANV
jgi:glycosyltransferase involved in cell wall biosynthesis